MADLDYDHFDGGYSVAHGHRFGRLTQLGGAALSMALILGGAVWAYQLAMRDIEGVPVIRAMGVPLRMAPANPGGEEAMHQGLSVNAVAAAGTALPLPDTLTLAPKPMDLAEDDIAGLLPLEPVGEAEGVAMAAPVLTLEAHSMPETLPQTQEDAVAAALAEALGLEPVDEVFAANGSAASDAEARASSPRPLARPGSTVANLDNVTDAIAPAAEMDPASIASGTVLVQLGAFDDEATARSEWQRLTGRFGELMAGKALVVQPAQSGGRTFFRLRAHGFANDDDTRRFCTAMLAENATCIPVAQR